MTEKQRKLMALQRRTLVLEDGNSEEEDVDICHYVREFLDGKYDEDLPLSKKLKAGVFDRKGNLEPLDRTD